MTHDTLLQLSIAILLLPLLSFVVLVFFHRRFPRQGDWLGTGLMFLGRAFEEARLLTIAAEFQKRTEWQAKRPKE